jgi:two-component system, NtrC family, sensor histidine kinase PilS
MEVLRFKLKWLVRLRVLVVSLLLGSWIYLQAGREVPALPAYYSLILATYLLTVIYSLLINRIVRLRALKTLAYLQIGLDLLIESVLVTITGGVESPFSLLYVMSIAAASAVLSRSGGLGAASAAGIAYGVIVDLQYYRDSFQILRFAKWFPASDLTAPTIFYNLSINLIGFIIVGYLTGMLAEKLVSTGERLEKKDRDLLGLKEFHQCILESIESGVFTTDPDGRLTSFNRRAEEITGHLETDARGRFWWDVFSWPASVREGKLTDAEPLARFEELARRKDGSAFILGLSLSPLHVRGIQTGLVGVFQDITPLKKMEEAVRRKQWLATIGEMSAGMAHEVRNPLAALSGAIQVLRKDLQPADVNRPLLDLALRETERLNSIVTDFLQYARPRRLNLQPVDVNALVDDTLRMLKQTPPYDALIQFVRDLDGADMTALLDRDQMGQVYWNLGLNACQSMPQGGILTVSTRRAGVSSGNHAGEAIEVVFGDTGIGIADEHLGKIFYPFYTTKENGTGLGLSIVFRVLEQHGGTVQVESAPGHGTRVRVLFPAGDRAEVGIPG